MSEAVSAPLTAGVPAPDLSFASTSGPIARLSELWSERPVLVAFFPLAFTRVCTAEVCEFSEDFDEYASRGVHVLPVSVDAVPSLQAFRTQLALSVDLYSDFKREASRAFGVLREDTFFSNRAYFLIDRGGVIRWAHVEETPGQKRDTAELLAAIDAVTQPT